LKFHGGHHGSAAGQKVATREDHGVPPLLESTARVQRRVVPDTFSFME
jgi:hypothetical protein